MIPLDDAQKVTLNLIAPLPAEFVPMERALGCVAAAPARARLRVPQFANAAMDGYAVRSSDTRPGGVRLEVTATTLAGDEPSDTLAAGCAVRIMTGAALPRGADAVCMQEEASTETNGTDVRIARRIEPGEHVRLPGEDVEVGQEVLGVGSVLGPSELGVMAGQGYSSALVHPRPKVGVISTGNELVASVGGLRPGTILDVNRPVLLASLASSGFTAVDLGTCGDDPLEIARLLESGITRCDAVISTGGISVGEADNVKSVLSGRCGGQARWMQIAIKPGKPFIAGIASGTSVPLFGLAGNPVAALVGFELLVRPALRRLAGHSRLTRTTVVATMECDVERRCDGKLHALFTAGSFHEDGSFHVERVVRHGSHQLSATIGANALLLVPDGEGLATRSSAKVLLLDAASTSASLGMSRQRAARGGARSRE